MWRRFMGSSVRRTVLMLFGSPSAGDWLRSRSRALLSIRIGALAGALSLSVSAQAPRASAVIDSAALLRDLQALSADDMQGRLIGSSGGLRARDYVVERFKAVGVQPFAGSFVQPFSFAVTARSG